MRVKLKLFVSGSSAASIKAERALRHVLKENTGNIDLEVIDVQMTPEVAITERIIAIPLLLRDSPSPRRRVVGDLTDMQAVLDALGLRAGAVLPQKKRRQRADGKDSR